VAGGVAPVGRALRVAAWIGPGAALWGALAAVGRIQTAEAAAVTNVLVALALPVTYITVLGAVVQASRRRRLALMRATALTFGLLLALGVMELAAAARLVHWELVLMFARGEQQHYMPDPDLGFRHAPNVRWSGRPRSDVEVACGLSASRADVITVTYDGHGYRNATALARADIALIGDSYVEGGIEGGYVSDHEVVSSFLQERLGRSVANLGVAGYGTAQELVVLQRDAMPLAPRVVIWFFFEGNDLYNDQEFENAMLAPHNVRATAWTEGHGWWRRSLIRAVTAQLRLMLSPFVAGYCPAFATVAAGPHAGRKVLFGPEAAAPWTDFERRRWESAQRTLQQAATVTVARGVKLLLVYVPNKFRVYRDFVNLQPYSELHRWTVWPLPELFAQFCRDNQLACLDLTGAFRAAVRAGGMPHGLTDSHWSPEGHRLVAERLEETLTSLGWLALGRDHPRRAGTLRSVQRTGSRTLTWHRQPCRDRHLEACGDGSAGSGTG
jgi:GDSL-like lipase/acylhydrolase family protein